MKKGNSQDRKTSVSLSVHHASKRKRSSQILMATALVNVKNSTGLSQSIRVLLDSASEANFITVAACVKIKYKTRSNSKSDYRNKQFNL